MILTYRYRIKDGASSTRRALEKQAAAVNFVWNFCCETDRRAADAWRAGRNVKRPSAFDLINLCRGVTRELGIHSDTVDAVCQRFADARQAIFPKTPRFRSRKRVLPWIPFSNFNRPAKLIDGILTLLKRKYRLWYSRPLPDNGNPKSWSIASDARGRWYINIHIELAEAEHRNGASVGIDLGLKTLATLSDGMKIEAPRFYRQTQTQFALFQRRRQKVRARALAIKIANQRKHFLHLAANDIVRRHAVIYVGNVSSRFLQRTNGKSASDAATAMLRNFLSYKAVALGGRCEIVSERWTTQACSCCGSLTSSTKPKGIGGLGIRHWVCDSCGSELDRDMNAAKNILRVGAERRPLGEEIPVLQGRRRR